MGIADMRKTLDEFLEGIEVAQVRRKGLRVPIMHLTASGQGFYDLVESGNDFDGLVLRLDGYERSYPLCRVKSIEKVNGRTLRVHAELDWVIEVERWFGETEARQRCMTDLGIEGTHFRLGTLYSVWNWSESPLC